MKKKLMSLMLLGLLSVGALVGCKDDKDPTTTVTPPTSTVIPDPSTPAPSTTELPPSTPSIVHVESIDVASDKANLYIGEKANLTITVLPENADDKTYALESSDTAIATIEGTVVTAVAEGEVTITATSTDGAKTDTVTIAVLEIPNPTLTIPGETTLSVAAGTPLTLPAVTASDYDGTDLTADIEVEDLAESGTIKDGIFNADIAGEHELSYYIECEDGRFAEQSLIINVTPANPEGFDVTGANDPAAIATYGVYKENFEKGRKAPLYAALTDGNGAASMTGTSDAIGGNSLVINTNKTAGSATNCVFLNAFNDIFEREIAVTYKVSFQYKILSDTVGTGIYFGLSWDGFDGLNNQFITGTTKGEVYDYSCSFPATKVPAAGNAYFRFFALSAISDDSIIAFDNFVFETVQCAQVTEVVPTAEELQTAGGFTWDFATNGSSASNGETVIINNIDNADAKAAMQADDDFGTNALRLTNADSHGFAGLTKDNMLAGKKMTITMKYYAANDSGFYLIMMGTAGNPTQEVTTSRVGSMVTVTCVTTVLDGWYQLNIYGAGNPAFDIYVGYINVVLEEADPIPEDETANKHKVGDSWTISSRQWGNEDKGNGLKIEAFDNNAEAIANEKMGTAPSKLSTTIGNATMEWYQGNGTIETGHVYEITCVYYVVDCSGRFMFNFDNNVFLNLDATPGFHEHTQRWTANRNVDFFCFFFPDNPTTATIYVAYTTVTLVEIVK